LLAVHTPDGLRRAVAGEDLAALQRVPGIGRKGAQRIVLELGDRLGAPAGSAPDAPAPVSTSGAHGQVVEALVGLGWNVKQAEEAVAAVGDGSGGSSSEVLRAALRHLGRS
jgi:Holliday junction DNA helicase RuvA